MSTVRVLLSVLLCLTAASAFSANDQVIEPMLALEEPLTAPDFELPDQQGQTRTLADYRDKVLVVNFWATWCAPCIYEMPALQNLRSALHEKGLEVLGINMGEGPDQIAVFNERVHVEFPLLLDENMAMAMTWEVQNLPTTFVVDRKGMIVYAEVGAMPWDDPVIMQQIEALLAN